MIRIALLSGLGAVILGALPACAQPDSYDAIMADCGGPIPARMVNTCLDRARALDRTNPSTQLRQLEDQLAARSEDIRERQQQQGAQPNGYPQNGYDQNGYPQGPGGDTRAGPPDYPDQGAPPPDNYGLNQGGDGFGDQAPPPPEPDSRGRYDYQGPGSNPTDQMAPPPGYDQDQGASPQEGPPPDAGAAPDDQGPTPDAGDGPDDGPPPDMSTPYDDGGPPVINDVPDDGPPPPPPPGPHR
ncbi:MAG: hypothetical protein ACREHE_11760 [Rhizomicrobium sp.]